MKKKESRREYNKYLRKCVYIEVILHLADTDVNKSLLKLTQKNMEWLTGIIPVSIWVLLVPSMKKESTFLKIHYTSFYVFPLYKFYRILSMIIHVLSTCPKSLLVLYIWRTLNFILFSVDNIWRLIWIHLCIPL